MRGFSLAILAVVLTLTAVRAYLDRPVSLGDFAALHGEGPRPLIRPPLYRPLAGLPFASAAAVWLALNVAAGLAYGFWAVRRTGATV